MAGELVDRVGDLGRVGRHELRLLLPAGERGVPGDRGDRAGPALGALGGDVGGEQQPPGHRPGVRAVLVGDRLGERPAEAVRLARAVRHVVDPRHRDAGRPGLVGEIGHQARLAHPGLAVDDDRRAAAGREAIDDGPQAAPLRLPADDRPDRRPPRLERRLAEEPEDADRPGLAAEQLRPLVLDVEALPRGVDGRLVEEDLVGPGDPLDPGGRRDRRPGQRPVERVVGAESGDDLAGRDPDMDLERLARDAVGAGLAAHRLADRQRAVGGPQGVVVVALGPAEHREHRVADELLAGPVERLDRRDHRPERRVDLPPDVLGIVLGDEPDVVDEIGEEGGHDPPITRFDVLARPRRPVGPVGRVQWRAALVAEPGRWAGRRATCAAPHPGFLPIRPVA